MAASHSFWRHYATALVLAALAVGPVLGIQLQLKDGRVLRGKPGMVGSLAETIQSVQAAGADAPQTIYFLDDDLRRTFFSKRQIEAVVPEEVTEVPEKFALQQRSLRSNVQVRTVGPIARVTPFDEYGRRIFSMFTLRGTEDIVQGITVLTPKWTKIEGITHQWDMRLATSSIPRPELAKILAKQGDPRNIEFRKRVARFYLQTEHYEDAARELEAIVHDFPEDPKLKVSLEPSIRKLRELRARQLLRELKLRRDAGQHRLVLAQLGKFTPDETPGPEMQVVRELVQEYQRLEKDRSDVLAILAAEVKKVDSDVIRKRLSGVLEEIATELNVSTLDRLSAFKRLASDKTLEPPEKVSLAISGWLLGSEEATPKLSRSVSLFETRELIRQYLTAADRLSRAQILEKFHSYEAGVPSLVARLLAQMKPPLDSPPPAEPGRPYEFEVPTVDGSPPCRYLVALPPEYDPHRRYPAIVTLHGAGLSTEQQLDWWAGAWSDKAGMRMGQAARHGFVVVAPDWTAEHQKRYQFSAREHAAALNSLRDACRRFSIDTDRVFLSGHSIGGDAAWDIGLAHPDLWAGVIPVVANAEKYCEIYWKNAARLPLYFICGELDGAKMTTNAQDFDRYLKSGYNATIVEFLGRGHEDFSDEIQRVFDWMLLPAMRREFFPKKFSTVTLRPWDNFFWWLELSQLPAKAITTPDNWPPRGRPVQTEASVSTTGTVIVRTGASQATIWLSPELVDLDKRVSVMINSERVNLRGGAADPKVETILEDVRTRGDRQHPFWVKIDTSTGRLDTSRSRP